MTTPYSTSAFGARQGAADSPALDHGILWRLACRLTERRGDDPDPIETTESERYSSPALRRGR